MGTKKSKSPRSKRSIAPPRDLNKRRVRSEGDRRAKQADRLARVMRLLELIQGHGRWNAKEIAAKQECSERTVYRDLDVLELAGVPFYFDESANCYRVREGWSFPVLNLTPDEIVEQGISTAIGKAANLQPGSSPRATTDKLSAKLNAKAGELLAEAEQVVQVLGLNLADHSKHSDIIRTAQWALIQRKQLTGQYQSPYQAKPVQVRLHPWRLALIKQAWYLIARPLDSDAPRTYRIARFKTLRMVDRPVELPEKFDLCDYLGNAWAVYRGDRSYDVELLFTKEAATLVTETNWHPTQQVHRNKDGSAIVRFKVDGLNEVVYWVLNWAGRVTVLNPPELRATLVEYLKKALAMNSI